MVEVMNKVCGDYSENAKVARKMWPGAVVLDLTMGGAMERLDPAFPLGRVEVPGLKRKVSLSVSGIWESMKIFSKKDVEDLSFLTDVKKLGKKRGCKCYGKLVGIKMGDEVLNLDDGVEEMFIKPYKRTMLERCGNVLEGIKGISKERTVVLLDYEENDKRYPVSHVELVKEMIME